MTIHTNHTFRSSPSLPKLRTLGAVAVLVLSGCGRGGGATAPAPTSGPWLAVPEAARVYYDNGGGLQDSLRVVIRDRETLQSYWSQATSRQSDPPPAPVVDFDEEVVLLVAAGRMTPEDQIRVDSLSVRRERDVSGDVTEYLAAMVRVVEACRRFAAEAYPVEIVRIQRYEGPIRFVERRDVVPCADPGGGAGR